MSRLNKTFWKKRTLSKNKSRFFQNKCNSFYYEKTLSRINYLYEKNNINDQIEFINNVKTPKLSLMLKQINWEQINAGVPVNFHGDLHFENIIKKKNKITLLDWREDFSGLINYGDIYYDLAKINHCFIIDHNVIKQKKFRIKFVSPNKIKLNYYQDQKNKICKKIFYKFLKKNNYSIKKVEILTALIYLNIAPLHHYPYSSFLFYLGKLELVKALKH